MTDHSIAQADKRTRILDAAIRVFAEHGYHGARVGDIAEDAGVAHGLLYHYFPSKQALLETLFEESMTDVRASFLAADAEPDPRQRIGALLRASADIVRDHREFWTLSYGVRMQRDVRAGLGPSLAAWTHGIVATLARYLRDAGFPQPEMEAALLFAQIDGLLQHYVLNPRTYPLDALIEALVDRYAQPFRKEHESGGIS